MDIPLRMFDRISGGFSLRSPSVFVQVMELDISGNNLGPEGAKARKNGWKKKGFPTAERPSRRIFWANECHLHRPHPVDRMDE